MVPPCGVTSTVDTDALATIMQRNCTVKKSDILAVLTALLGALGSATAAGVRI